MARTVLIIDDDQTLVAPLKDGLESLGYRVAVAFDGMQGIVQAHETRPDAIILDYHMPGGGGQTVYERLRTAPDTAATPIVFSTVVKMEDLASRLKASPNTFFLRKPVGLQQISRVLDTILAQRKASSADKPVPAKPSPAKAKPAAGAGGPKVHEFSVRVTYADTDKMGIIYYANYFKYFEQGRTELLRSLGVRYRDLEIQRKLFIPAVEASCRYLAPSRYDDLLIVRTWISSLGKASIGFEHEITDQDLGGKLVARGRSRHAIVNDLWRTARVPEELRALLAPFIGESPAAETARV